MGISNADTTFNWLKAGSPVDLKAGLSMPAKTLFKVFELSIYEGDKDLKFLYLFIYLNGHLRIEVEPLQSIDGVPIFSHIVVCNFI